jgi:hypothetical protein
MAFNAPPIKAGTPADPIKAGTYTAICYGVIDEGHQDATDFNGNPEIQHQVRLLFELPDERMDDGRPRGTSKKMKLSMHEKANLRKATQSLLGRQLSDAEAMGIDLATLIGHGCNISMIEKPRRDGKVGPDGKPLTISYVDGFSALKKREADTLPDPENAPVVYQIEDGQPPDSLPDWLREEILKAKEWNTGATANQRQTAQRTATPSPTTATYASDDPDDPDGPPF